MQPPIPNFGEWPDLEWGEWKDTAETLHMYMQIVGKTRLALTPVQNHWWNVPLYVTSRGLWTSPMPTSNGQLLDVEFDFLAHQVVCRTSLGEIRRIPLNAKPVAEFFREFSESLAGVGVRVSIGRMPVEVANPIRCDLDTVHCSAVATRDSRSAWTTDTTADSRVTNIVAGSIRIDTPNHVDVPLAAGEPGPAIDLAGEINRSALSAICMTLPPEHKSATNRARLRP